MLTAPAESDVLPIVDVSEAAATDKNKRYRPGAFLRVRLLVRNQRLALLLSLMTATITLLERRRCDLNWWSQRKVTNTGTTITGDLTVSGTTTTIESTTVTVDDKNIELVLLLRRQIQLLTVAASARATDKTINYVQSTGYWTFSEGIEVGGHLQIDDDNEIRVGNGARPQVVSRWI